MARQERRQLAERVVEDGKRDMLGNALAVPRAQGEQYRRRRIDAAGKLQHRRAAGNRDLVAIAGDIHKPGNRLQHPVRKGRPRERARRVPAECGYVTDNRRLVQRGLNGIGPWPVQVAGGDDRVGPADKRRDGIAGFRIVIQRNIPLSSSHVGPQRPFRAIPRGVRRFDDNNGRAKLPQKRPARRRRQPLAQFNNQDVGRKGWLHGASLRCFPAPANIAPGPAGSAISLLCRRRLAGWL